MSAVTPIDNEGDDDDKESAKEGWRDSTGAQRRASRTPSKREEWSKRVDENAYVTMFIMAMIVFSTTCFILETHLPEYQEAWATCEAVAVIIFTIEYLVKLAIAPDRIKFVFTPMCIVDLVAILPWWIEQFMSNKSFSLSFVRAIRLIRVFRVFKFGRYSMGVKIFLGALKMSMLPMSILLFLMLIAMIFFSSLVVMFEEPSQAALWGYDQPNKQAFSSIPNGFWWCIVTMTTVGYGDAVPVTPMGKVVATVTMVSGLLILALPITVVGSNFSKMMEIYEEDMNLLSNADKDKSGDIDEDELRIFLHNRRKEGALPPEFNKTAFSLLEEYDEDGKGYLTNAEFMKLTNAILVRSAQTAEPSTRDLKDQITNHRVVLEDRLENIEKMLERMLRSAGVEPDIPHLEQSSNTSIVDTPTPAQGNGCGH